MRYTLIMQWETVLGSNQTLFNLKTYTFAFKCINKVWVSYKNHKFMDIIAQNEA